MINSKDIASIPFLKKSPYTGSYQGMRYRIQKEEIEEKLHLKVFAWKEPFAFDKTPEEEKISEIFDFSDDGLKNILEWLETTHALLVK